MLYVVGAFHFMLLGNKICCQVFFMCFGFYHVFQGDLLCYKNRIQGVGRGQIGLACCRCR
jgi:hypothetical protein